MNVEENKLGPAKNVFTFSLDPDRFFLTSSKLDYTLVAVNDHVDGNSSINDFGWHALLNVQGKIRVGDPVNIVQHPNGNDKAVVVHNSHFLHLENGTDIEEFCWYSGDTKEGSSGSPVFNNRWEVIALHHQSVPETNRRGRIVDRNGRAMSKRRLNENPEDIAWVANEGIRISRIFQSIQNASIDDSDQCKIRDDLIALWSAPAAQKRGQRAAENKRHE